MPPRERGHRCLEMKILGKLKFDLGCSSSGSQPFRREHRTQTPQACTSPSALAEQSCAKGWETFLNHLGEEGGEGGILTNPIYFHRSNVTTVDNYNCINLHKW